MKNSKKLCKIVRLMAIILCCNIIAGIFFGISALATEEVPEELSELYAASAVLLDADSGRVLYGKSELEPRAMASTTKIMTCILALENGDLTSVVTASDEACRQPKVHLGMRSQEQFYLKDLLYSLMLESHNDSAVAIAEHIGSSTTGFADMMNAKAKEIGCEDTYFITPNGLDAEDENGIHSTTAADLARIMKYCVVDSPKRTEFIAITGEASYQFAEITGSRVFSCNNHNSFLNMMNGAFSGKTGYTSQAGYCYVGALKRNGKTLIVALLACGWPNNKSYKWSDTKKLMEYGLDNYESVQLWEEMDLAPVTIGSGIPQSDNLFDEAYTDVTVVASEEEQEQKILLHTDEDITIETQCADSLEAPVEAGTSVGSVVYSIGGETIAAYEIVTSTSIEQKSYVWNLQKVIDLWLKLL